MNLKEDVPLLETVTVASSVIFLALVARTHAGHEGTRAFLLSQPHEIKSGIRPSTTSLPIPRPAVHDAIP